MIDNTKEYILCAAIEMEEPTDNISYHPGSNDIHKIQIGFRHHDIFNRFYGKVKFKVVGQGFYTSKGRFVNRKEAAVLAFECGQIQSKKIRLFSEDIY